MGEVQEACDFATESLLSISAATHVCQLMQATCVFAIVANPGDALCATDVEERLTEVAPHWVSAKSANQSVTQCAGLAMEDSKCHEEKLWVAHREFATTAFERGRHRAIKQAGCRRLFPDFEAVLAQDADGYCTVGCCLCPGCSQSVLLAVFAAEDRFRDKLETTANEQYKFQAITALLAATMLRFDGALAGLQAALGCDLARARHNDSLKNLASVVDRLAAMG